MFYYLFDTINISLLITALLNVFLGILVFSKWKKRVNIVFGLNVIAVISWTLAMFFYRSAPVELNMLWCTILYVTPTLIASSFLYFTYIFPSQTEKNIWWRALIIFGVNLALIVMIIWPGLTIKEVNLRPGQEKQIIFTSYYWFYFLYTLFLFSFGFFRLFVKYLKSRGIERLQIIYLAIGYSLAANFAFATNLIMPWIGYFFLNWLGQIFTLIGVGSTTYAILKYRLMDIRVVFRKTVVYFVSAGFVYAMFYFVIWLYNKIFGSVYTRGAYLLSLIIAPLFVLLFVWLNDKIKVIANKYLFFSLYSHQEIIEKLTEKLTQSIDLNKIVDSIVKSIKEAMQVNRAGVLLIDQDDKKIKYKIAKVIGFDENNGISLVEDNFLTQHLEKTQKLLVRDELDMIAKDLTSPQERQRFFQLSKNMKHIEASLCLPMIISNKLVGIIVLGSKVSGDAYTSDDLNLLSTLSKQAAVAVDNAQLYRKVHDFSKTLQQKVDEQTKEIKHAYEVEKRAHEDLKQLDEAKTNFMLATQHHLRTPLSVNKGFLDLLLSGKYGKVPAKIKKAILEISNSTEKEIKVVNELLDVSSYQLGRGYIQAKPGVSVKNILEEIISILKPFADSNKIFLNFENKGPVPDITADGKQLTMALQNIVDNAVKYTKKGGVTVNLEAEKDKIKIIVVDTGIGMEEKEAKHLFKKPFQRSKEAWTANAIGKGIGLYLSAQIIKAHDGKIQAHSEGLDKGSTFFIELPILHKQ